MLFVALFALTFSAVLLSNLTLWRILIVCFCWSCGKYTRPYQCNAMDNFANFFIFSLLMFAFDFSTEGAEFCQGHAGFFFIGSLAVPFELAFELAHAFAGNGTGNDD